MTDVRRYTIGFIVSIALTLAAYGVVVSGWFGGYAVLVAIMVFAALQGAGQLIFFLHLSKKQSRHNAAAFWMMILVLLIIVVGSLWIMAHLNYNMMLMTSEEKDSYMLEQSSKGF